jgi:hypothetical protein
LGDGSSKITPHELEEYEALIRQFVQGEIPAAEFETEYMRMFLEDPTMWPEEKYELLNGLFGDVESFSADPTLRGPKDFDEVQLRASAEKTLARLDGMRGPCYRNSNSVTTARPSYLPFHLFPTAPA